MKKFLRLVGATLLMYMIGLGCDDDDDPGVVDAGDGATPAIDAGDDAGPGVDAGQDAAVVDAGEGVPQPQTVTAMLTCPTTVGLDVGVLANLTVAPQGPFLPGEETITTVSMAATQQALEVSLDAELDDSSWTVAVAGGMPAEVVHVEDYDPNLMINVGMDNQVDGGAETLGITPDAEATEVGFGLTAVALTVAVGEATLEVTCAVPVDVPQAVFGVDVPADE
jgi:hypothetical protein